MTGSGTCGPKNEGDRGRGAYILKLEWVCYRLTRCCEHSTGPTTHQTSPMLAERYWLWVSTCFKQPQTPLVGHISDVAEGQRRQRTHPQFCFFSIISVYLIVITCHTDPSTVERTSGAE